MNCVFEMPPQVVYTMNSLALCASTPAPVCVTVISPRKGLDYPVSTKVECIKENKKEQTMNLYEDEDDMDIDTNSTKLNYLQSRLNNVRYARDNELEKEYGLRDDERPLNFNEFLARITAGKYTIDEKNKTKNCYTPLDYIRWRDPSVKEDQEGYRKANAALTAAAIKAADTIVVMSDDATRLAALRDFEKAAAAIQ